MKKLVAMLLVFTMSISLAACGGNKSSESTSGESKANESTVGDTKAAEENTAASVENSGEPVSGGTVNIPITDDPTTLQGWMLRNTNESALAPAIYETLLRYDETGKPQPFLLESFEGDPEALTYTMVVRDGITFQDGTPLDAEAVKWNCGKC